MSKKSVPRLYIAGTTLLMTLICLLLIQVSKLLSSGKQIHKDGSAFDKTGCSLEAVCEKINELDVITYSPNVGVLGGCG